MTKEDSFAFLFGGAKWVLFLRIVRNINITLHLLVNNLVRLVKDIPIIANPRVQFSRILSFNRVIKSYISL